jgi:threonine dehydrogenase-like Zn-dependent dehydrogenase
VRGVVMYGPGDVRVEDVAEPKILGHVGYVGVTHEVELPGMELFFSHVHLQGGPAPVRRFLPELMRLIADRRIDSGKVFDLGLPIDQAADGYTAMDERHAIKVLLRP